MLTAFDSFHRLYQHECAEEIMDQRYVHFWVLNKWGENNEDKFVGVRGWCKENRDRYELSQEADKWVAAVVITFKTDPDGWGFAPVATGDLFHCMVEVEKHAKARAEAPTGEWNEYGEFEAYEDGEY